jgi:F-type H+-transporting ATPase subunit delta
MTSGRAARRYAAALFDVTQKNGSADAAGQSLAQLQELISGHVELSRTLASAAIPVTVKRDILLALVDAVGNVPVEVRRMLAMLADRDRLAELPELAGAFALRLMDVKRILQADIVTAVPLSDASRAALTAALGRATGKSVSITERVDPAIIGGVIAKVGSFVYDASLMRQLERMRDTLTAGQGN